MKFFKGCMEGNMEAKIKELQEKIRQMMVVDEQMSKAIKEMKGK